MKSLTYSQKPSSKIKEQMFCVSNLKNRCGMKHLWAPWRIEYIEQSSRAKARGKQAKCFLCLKNSKSDASDYILVRGKHAFVIMNRYPYNAGHLMVAPYRHVGMFEKLKPEEANEIFLLLQKSIVVLKKVFSPVGFNIGLNIGEVAGAGVPGHLHVHLIPRWLGDTNFMPIVGQTKIINEELEKMYKRLKRAMK